MNSQFVALDAGKHNSNLEESSRHVLEGGSWKKQRIIVIIPAGKMMPTKAALALWALAFPPNQQVYRIGALGMEVGEAYSNAIAGILADPELSQWEYILTVEHDNIPPWNGIPMLIESMEQHPEYSAISGLYWCKGESAVPQIWGDPNDPTPNFRPQIPQIGQVQPCNGIGMGFALWRVSMFKDERLRRPWFKTLNGAEGQGCGTQDLYFASDALKYGYRFAVDNRVLVGHLDINTDIIW